MRRLLWVPLILFVVSAVTFTLARLGPGDPIRIASGQFRDPEAFERIRASRGLDKPIWRQYLIYVKNVLTKASFGESYRYKGREVTEVLLPALWRSAQYNSIAMTVTMTAGMAVGVFAARNQGSWQDPAAISFFLLLQSIPGLISVPVLLLLFALKAGLLPASGWPRDCGLELSFLGDNYKCIGVLSKEAIIPLIALSIPGIGAWARYTRAFTVGVLREDYVRTARSKGIREFHIMTRHVLRNALLPLSTIIGFSLLGLLEGSFFVETLTGVPGVGRLSFEAITGRDYDMIMAVVMIGASSFVMVSIAVDIGYTLIDPRVRFSAKRG